MSTVIGKKFWLFLKSIKDYKKINYKREMTYEDFDLLARIKKIAHESNAVHNSGTPQSGL